MRGRMQTDACWSRLHALELRVAAHVLDEAMQGLTIKGAALPII